MRHRKIPVVAQVLLLLTPMFLCSEGVLFIERKMLLLVAKLLQTRSGNRPGKISMTVKEQDFVKGGSKKWVDCKNNLLRIEAAQLPQNASWCDKIKQNGKENGIIINRSHRYNCIKRMKFFRLKNLTEHFLRNLYCCFVSHPRSAKGYFWCSSAWEYYFQERT